MASFFSEPQGAAIFKHELLKRYIAIYVSKVGRFSPGGRVAYLDGFAGAGSYEDGSPGSPALALATAEALSSVRDLRCYFVERDTGTYKKLADNVARAPGADHARVVHGDISEELDRILGEVSDAPLFAFLDPFGLGLPFDQLVGRLMTRSTRKAGRRVGPSTEVMVNFVHAGIYRTAGKLKLSSANPIQVAAAAATIAEVNTNLGGTWWQEIWRSRLLVADRVTAIRDGYLQRVMHEAGSGWSYFQVPVSDTWRGKTIYDLVLLTQHEQGIWFFNESVSLARGVFRQEVEPGLALTPQLWGPEDEWHDVIVANLRDLVRQGTRFRVFDRLTDVYGETLGAARQTHLRKALQRVYDEDLITLRPKGDLMNFAVVPTARHTPSH
jgi:three-Cys-motif partner protein